MHQAGNYYVLAICVNKIGDIVFTKGASICQISDGEVTTLAGVCDQRGHTDGVGENARFSNSLGGLAAGGPDGSIIVSDTLNHCIRRIAPDGTTSTLAGAAGVRGFSDGQGAAAKFYSPTGVAVDGEGNVYVADLNNHRIRKITPGGVVTNFAGSGALGSTDGPGACPREWHREPHGCGSVLRETPQGCRLRPWLHSGWRSRPWRVCCGEPCVQNLAHLGAWDWSLRATEAAGALGRQQPGLRLHALGAGSCVRRSSPRFGPGRLGPPIRAGTRLRPSPGLAQ